MKKCILILIPFLSFGQISYEKIGQEFGISPDYSLFRAKCDLNYTQEINKDRARVHKSPLVNSEDLNNIAYQRAMLYAEKIVQNPDVYLAEETKDTSNIFSSVGEDGLLYGTAHNGAIKPENFAGTRVFIISIPPGTSLKNLTTHFVYSDTLGGSCGTYDNYLLQVWLPSLYQNSSSHLNTRRNTGGGQEKQNWREYGYAIVVVYFKAKHPHIEGLESTYSVTVSYEVFSE